MTAPSGSEQPALLPAPKHVDYEKLDAVLAGLLDQDPPPLAIAFDENGLTMPMPAALSIRADRVLALTGSALEITPPQYLPKIVEAFERARLTGTAKTLTQLRGYPGPPVTLHLIDARHRYGVFLGLIAGSAAEAPVEDRTPSLFRPRLCSLQRDQLGVIVEIDDATTQILGWSRADLVGMRTLDIIYPEDQPAAIASWVQMLGRPGFHQRGLFRYRHLNGNYVWLESTNENRLADPAIGRVLTQLIDVSDRMEAVEALRASEQLLRRLTEALPVGIVQIDLRRRIVHTNERLGAIVGVDEPVTLEESLRVATPRDRESLNVALRAVLLSGTPADIELTLAHPAGDRRCSIGLRALTDDHAIVTGAVLYIADITASVLMREELVRRAMFDDLTRCHNRPAILSTLASLLSVAQRAHTATAVLFIDLDRFKEINDRFGHAAGDKLLRRVAQRLLRSARAGDVVGRLGGDEFLVVCPDVPSPGVARTIATRFSKSISQKTLLDSQSVVPAASIGIAWTDLSIDVDALVAKADAAMYESKQRGGQPVFFEPHRAPA